MIDITSYINLRLLVKRAASKICPSLRSILTVSVLTNDARNIVGTLRGIDQHANIILDDSHERVYSSDGVEQGILGLYVIRGDNIAVVGPLDKEIDKTIDFSSLNAVPLRSIVH